MGGLPIFRTGTCKFIVLLVIVALYCEPPLALAGQVNCLSLCPDPTGREFGSCFAAGFVDPADGQCFSCTGTSKAAPLPVPPPATTTTAASSEELLETPTVTAASSTPAPPAGGGSCGYWSMEVGRYAILVDARGADDSSQYLVLDKATVVVTSIGARAEVELRLGRVALMTKSVGGAAGSVSWSGIAIGPAVLQAAAAGSLRPWNETSVLFLAITCLSGLDDRIPCPVAVSFDYRWLSPSDPALQQYLPTPEPPLAIGESGEAKGLSTGAIIAIATCGSIVCLAIAAGLGVCHFKRQESAARKVGKVEAAVKATTQSALNRSTQYATPGRGGAAEASPGDDVPMVLRRNLGDGNDQSPEQAFSPVASG
jgi:hypothetical protein